MEKLEARVVQEAGYYDMKLIWDQEDKEAVAASGNPAFSEIKG